MPASGSGRGDAVGELRRLLAEASIANATSASELHRARAMLVAAMPALLDRLEAAEAWRESVIAEVTRWAAREVAPMAITGGKMYVPKDAYDDAVRTLHMAMGAVEALEAEVRRLRDLLSAPPARGET